MQTYDADIESWMVSFYATLSEKDQRRYAAVEAAKLGHGGKAYLSRLFGCDPDTIAAGERDVEQLPVDAAENRVRKKGGRKKASLSDPELLPVLRKAVEHETAGSPVEPDQLWTNRSAADLSRELAEEGHPADPKTVQRMLREELGLSHRQMEKTVAMGESADREAQFQQLKMVRSEYVEQGYPVVSIDTKKKELLGDFYRSGPAWTNGRVRAWDHDFPSSASGKVIPYGVYDVCRNESLMYLAQGADTGHLAVDAVRRWWHRLGKWNYPADAPLLLLADCGGSNGYRVPLFREHLQLLANGLNKVIRVCHLPPYCSKYNPIDHRLFCHITRSLQSVMVRSVEIIRDAIASTTTTTGRFDHDDDRIASGGRTTPQSVCSRDQSVA